MKLGDMIDYESIHWHRKRKGASGERLGKCPKCGRRGEITLLDDGRLHVVHKMQQENWYYSVKDSCLIKKETTQ